MLSIVVATVGFFGGIQLYGLVPQLFFPQQATNFFVAELTFPPGTSIRTTEAMIEDMETYIQSDLAAKEGKDGITHWASFISTTPPRFTLTYNPATLLAFFVPGLTDIIGYYVNQVVSNHNDLVKRDKDVVIQDRRLPVTQRHNVYSEKLSYQARAYHQTGPWSG